MRDMNKWSQATLAEIARVTERTVQRVENGEPASLETRRALARAFGCDDLDIFEKPWPFPNVEKLKAHSAELDKTTVVVPITRIRDARTLRTMTESAECSATEELGELAPEAREAFASIVDYLRDYNDVSDLYSMAQRLEVDRDLDASLKTVAEAGAVVGAITTRESPIQIRRAGLLAAGLDLHLFRPCAKRCSTGQRARTEGPQIRVVSGRLDLRLRLAAARAFRLGELPTPKRLCGYQPTPCPLLPMRRSRAFCSRQFGPESSAFPARDCRA
jgi:transcriptional regulator with XRE-family HTH domain